MRGTTAEAGFDFAIVGGNSPLPADEQAASGRGGLCTGLMSDTATGAGSAADHG